jgi:hypothetical protein
LAAAKVVPQSAGFITLIYIAKKTDGWPLIQDGISLVQQQPKKVQRSKGSC